MAGSLNKVQLIGNLGRDPEIRSFQNGGQVANLRLATSETWKDRTTGERRERTEWHSIAIFSEPLVKLVENYVKKGAKLYIEGQLETRKWQDQNGNDKYTTEVVLRPYKSTLVMLDGRRSEDSQNSQQNGGGYSPQQNTSSRPPTPSAGGHSGQGYNNSGPGYGGTSSYPGYSEDEIPF
jgi:single-strand DNA-binding protein